MTAPERAQREISDAGRRASGSSVLRGLARAGLVARGLIYAMVGLLAMGVAFGHQNQADRSGALEQIVRRPGGGILLWLIIVGFAGLALWQLAEAAYGGSGHGHQDGASGGQQQADSRDRPGNDVVQTVKRHKDTGKRLFHLFRAVIYTVACATSATFAIGAGSQKSSDSTSKDYSGKAMHQVPGGQWIVFLVGLALVGGGIAIVVSALKTHYMKNLDTASMSPRARKVIEKLGLVGHLSRGIIFAVAGGFLAYAGAAFDPSKAKGVDGTLREFSNTPAGPWLLVLIAAGLITFGVYSCCEARYRRVDPG